MVLLEARNVKKYFGEVHAVDDVTVQVGEAEIVSLVGPNGAGKTTLVNLLSGFFPPDSGEVIFRGKDITNYSPQRRIKAGIARSFQLVNLYDRLTALDNVRIAILSRLGRTKRFLSLLDSDKEARKEAVHVLELLGLAGKEEIVAKGLAQGDRKLLDVAIAFALNPKLLILDEPTSGVSTREKGKIMDTIVSAVKKEKISSAIVEHDMDIVFNYSDRVIVMREGKVLADGKPAAIKDNAEVRATLLGA